MNIDAYKLQAAQLTLGDIQRAIANENLTITGGTLPLNGMKPTLSIKSEFKSPSEIENIIVSSQVGAKLFIKDFATVTDGFEEQESYSSSNGKNVITMNIIKRSGENLIEAAALMEANLEEPLSLDEIAKLVGVSRRQIERLFKRYVGEVPTKYYLDMRLRRARELLLQTAQHHRATLVIATHDARVAPLIPAGPEGHAGFASLRLTRPAPPGATA